jgi:hypothetical protein
MAKSAGQADDAMQPTLITSTSKSRIDAGRNRPSVSFCGQPASKLPIT